MNSNSEDFIYCDKLNDISENYHRKIQKEYMKDKNKTIKPKDIFIGFNKKFKCKKKDKEEKVYYGMPLTTKK